MNAPESFDRKSILSMVNTLYARGARLPRVYGAMGFFIGFLLGLARNPFDESSFWWIVPASVGLLCAGIGRMRGQMMNFDLKLRGQTALCHLELVDGIQRLNRVTDSANTHEKSDGDREDGKIESP